MTRSIGRALVAAGLALAFALPASAQDEMPKVGDQAPEFTMTGSDGKDYSLSDFKGEKAVVLAWFPKAFTGGCTKQCTAYAQQGDLLKDLNVAYFTASTDTVEDNTKFAESVGADYPILSDPGGEVAKKYGVMMPDRPLAKRVTFYIDKEGIVRGIDTMIVTEDAGAETAEMLKELGLTE
ncbi:peroxiredoxin family protein [Tautonia plasticadhaerens]|uniref:thioredoxin-dependent peroxiredoxin n=1 Tax=Tautonia plasticadhaerens TaxID=2527974 RepID=A0A518GWU3_9BACT|nr:peroxiredoxin family protein [Tautonia plasticadhaerens]QDV33064.1 Putative peroxiredoxin bcp [Tautonia plasticadhaerens]